jgi:hypothetical protein
MLILGKYLTQYEAHCLREGRQNRMPPTGTLKRTSIQSPWVLSGVAVAGFALYWWLSTYQQEFRML